MLSWKPCKLRSWKVVVFFEFYRACINWCYLFKAHVHELQCSGRLALKKLQAQPELKTKKKKNKPVFCLRHKFSWHQNSLNNIQLCIAWGDFSSSHNWSLLIRFMHSFRGKTIATPFICHGGVWIQWMVDWNVDKLDGLMNFYLLVMNTSEQRLYLSINTVIIVF